MKVKLLLETSSSCLIWLHNVANWRWQTRVICSLVWVSSLMENLEKSCKNLESYFKLWRFSQSGICSFFPIVISKTYPHQLYQKFIFLFTLLWSLHLKCKDHHRWSWGCHEKFIKGYPLECTGTLYIKSSYDNDPSKQPPSKKKKKY